ncbi:hypothetical protein ADK43_40035 [Streptomyces rimosus subsp. rimosus]|nr:hypothetical protein ADK43_40035 [Streptomyces rimosus subsp. rimosus]
MPAGTRTDRAGRLSRLARRSAAEDVGIMANDDSTSERQILVLQARLQQLQYEYAQLARRRDELESALKYVVDRAGGTVTVTRQDRDRLRAAARVHMRYDPADGCWHYELG